VSDVECWVDDDIALKKVARNVVGCVQVAAYIKAFGSSVPVRALHDPGIVGWQAVRMWHFGSGHCKKNRRKRSKGD
jgi:hypothetical protein